MGLKLKKIVRVAARAVAAVYTGGTSEALIAAARAKAGKAPGAGEEVSDLLNAPNPSLAAMGYVQNRFGSAADLLVRGTMRSMPVISGVARGAVGSIPVVGGAIEGGIRGYEEMQDEEEGYDDYGYDDAAEDYEDEELAEDER